MSREAPLSVPNQMPFLSSAAQNTVLLSNPSETVNDSHCPVGRSLILTPLSLQIKTFSLVTVTEWIPPFFNESVVSILFQRFVTASYSKRAPPIPPAHIFCP